MRSDKIVYGPQMAHLVCKSIARIAFAASENTKRAKRLRVACEPFPEIISVFGNSKSRTKITKIMKNKNILHSIVERLIFQSGDEPPHTLKTKRNEFNFYLLTLLFQTKQSPRSTNYQDD